MKTVIISLIIFLLIFVLANIGQNVTNATSVSQLNPNFSYADATNVAELK